MIGRAFFPASNPNVSLLLSVATIGFVARPLGSLLIGAYADHFGRKPALGVRNFGGIAQIVFTWIIGATGTSCPGCGTSLVMSIVSLLGTLSNRILTEWTARPALAATPVGLSPGAAN